MLSRRGFMAASTLGFALDLAPAAFAQVGGQVTRIVTGFPPGGSSDTVARLLAEKIRGSYAPNVIVENRPGAGGRIGLEAVKNAPADGSTMILTPASMIVIYPHIYKKLAYDPLRDFAPVTTVCTFTFAFSVGPAVPAAVKSVGDFVQWAKANPTKASFGSPAAGSVPHFTGVMLGRAAGIELAHVAFRGGAPAIQDLIGGHIPASINVLGEALPHVPAGQLRVLATTAAKRSRFLPDVPTLAESGFPEIDAGEWFGIFAPAATPPDTVARLNAALVDALRSKEIVDGLAKFGFEPAGTSPAEFAQSIREQHARWAPIVQASGFSAED
jgi:tripartite-type tricarboxylate transporter receptor subunit TctC